VFVIDEFDCADSCRDTMQNVAIFDLFGPIFDSPRFGLMMLKEKLLDKNDIIHEYSESVSACVGVIVASLPLLLTETDIFKQKCKFRPHFLFFHHK
jgi:hypothetical protein